MVDALASGGTTGGGAALPTELKTLAKVALLEGQWRLVKPIGQGKSGVVWEAHDVTLDRRVAVKVMHEALTSSPAQVARFERETRVLATLEHLNLTPVLGSGRWQGRPFVVMRLLVGRTVAELMHARGGKLPLGEAAFCLLPVCDALKALHDTGVVHRDLKPSNVFISDEGAVTLLDLGQAFESGSDLTRTGEVQGAAEYLSPEQIAGRPANPSSDVYALGCLLYELLMGSPPFTGELPEVLMAHSTAPRPTPSALGAPAVGAMVVKMLSVDPLNRPQLSEVRAGLAPHVQLPPLALPSSPRVPSSPGLKGTPQARSSPPAPRVEPTDGIEPTGLSRTAVTPAREAQPTALDPVRREGPTDERVTGPHLATPERERETVEVVALKREEPSGPAEPTTPGPAPASSAQAEPDGTRMQQQALIRREKETQPNERPLSRSALTVLAVAAVAVLGFVALGLSQGEPAPPPPVRVDAPYVVVELKKAEAVPPAAATTASSVPPPAVARFEERKETVNSAPYDAPVRRGRVANRTPPARGYVRIITTVGGNEIPCRLFVDGRWVGHTPYLSPLLRKGEHALRAECLGWPVEDLVWPFPQPERQKQGMVIEIPLGAEGLEAEARRPMPEEDEHADDPPWCPNGQPCVPEP
jgi:serine/threonine protein kinase